MKKFFIVLFVVLIHLKGFAQVSNQTIKITEDIGLIKLTENAYIHVSFLNMPSYGKASANGLVFINGNKAFLFDTPWTDSLTAELYTWFKDSLNINIVGVIPNHWHEDCMGGLQYLHNKNVESYSNQMTIEIAKSKGLPVPLHGFRDSLEIKFDDKLIKCYFFGAAHSADNIVVWIPSEKILFPGCMVKSMDSDNLGNTRDGDLDVYPRTIERLLKHFPDAKIVIPGHGQHGGTDLIKHTLELATL